ncbi:RluA family pseudouridine synthase [Bacillus suaedaesalsae]|uniref:Pseudouridine synthase n=1 Tax=Bacillus suaedaesalsae TaxID=2810349 RepID=A0ABS2DF17_9BACI|nr:RluA family pseudouridine synthase [Bacillus suaedaesalsae]
MQTEKKGEFLQIIAPSQYDGKTIEQIAKEELFIPKKLLHVLRMEKGITLNGDAVDWATQVKKKDRLFVKCFQPEEYGVIPQEMDIDVLYEDDHLLIVNKPIGIDTHPTEANQTGTLANGIAYYWQLHGLMAKVRHVHRLDHDTSGAILFAKHHLASSLLDGMLERRDIKRTYIAFAEGMVRQKKGTIHESIGRDRHHPTRRRVSNTGQKAITHYEVIKVFNQSKITKLQLQLDTGRTHQIRVHLSHIGHPLVGDQLYGGTTHSLKAQGLHAARISFQHPITKEKFQIEASLPAHLSNFEKKLS